MVCVGLDTRHGISKPRLYGLSAPRMGPFFCAAVILEPGGVACWNNVELSAFVRCSMIDTTFPKAASARSLGLGPFFETLPAARFACMGVGTDLVQARVVQEKANARSCGRPIVRRGTGDCHCGGHRGLTAIYVAAMTADEILTLRATVIGGKKSPDLAHPSHRQDHACARIAAARSAMAMDL